MYTEWTESGDIDGDEWGKEAAGWRVDVECDARTGGVKQKLTPYEIATGERLRG